jgi:hypothetical protein
MILLRVACVFLLRLIVVAGASIMIWLVLMPFHSIPLTALVWSLFMLPAIGYLLESIDWRDGRPIDWRDRSPYAWYGYPLDYLREFFGNR